MSGASDAELALMDYLGKHYGFLKRRLVHRLGDAEAAGDALHDTWLRLKGAQQPGCVDNPAGYLSRMAVNIAVDAQRRQSRMLSGSEIDELLDELADPAPGPDQAAEGQSELEALLAFLARMPARRRTVALLVHAEGLTQREAARRLGVSLRTVEYELRYVHERLNAYLAAQEE